MPPLKKSEKRMLIAIGVMVVALAWNPNHWFYGKPPGEASSATPGAGVEAAPAQPNASVAAKGAPAIEAPGAAVRPRREPIHFANWGRDPFVQVRRGQVDAAAVSGFKLGGISVRGNDCYALINSQIVREGDIIGGMTITRIEREKVILSKGGQSFALTWGQP